MFSLRPGVFLAVIALLSAVSGLANEGAGYGTGNGGDPCEKRIQEIREDLSVWIQKGGANGLTLPNSVCVDQYNRGMLAQIASAQVSCTERTVQIGSAEKTCKNFIDDQGQARIVCNVSRFMQQTSESDQYVLIHHEYAGLAGFEENTGEISDYAISSQLSGFLEDRVMKRLAIKPKPVSSMVFVKIEPGTFSMGSPESEGGRELDEVRHQVTLSQEFEMQATTVTQAQWFAVMKSNPSYFSKSEHCPTSFIVHENVGLCPNNPVEQVSWNDVQVFLLKFNMAHQNGGYFYRLPTEAEWEYAARAGTQTTYYFGNDPRRLFAYGWYEATSGMQTREVGSLKPNAFGLYDMAGNVWQWVNDAYGNYSQSSVTDPTGPFSGSKRVLRGGSWYDNAQRLRSAYRGYAAPDFHSAAFGFRLVRTR